MLLDLTNLKFSDKVGSSVYFTTFPHYHSSLALCVKQIYQKESLLTFVKCSLSVENTRNFGACISQNCNFWEQFLFGTFWLFILYSIDRWQYSSKYSKTLI